VEPRFAEVPGLRPRLLQQEPEVGALAARRHLAGPFRGVVRLALGVVAVPVRGEVSPAGAGRRGGGGCALLLVRGRGLVGPAAVHRVRALRLRRRFGIHPGRTEEPPDDTAVEKGSRRVILPFSFQLYPAASRLFQIQVNSGNMAAESGSVAASGVAG
jgi:hypothetical protein